MFCEPSGIGDLIHDAFEFVGKLERLKSLVAVGLFRRLGGKLVVRLDAERASVFGAVDFVFLEPWRQAKFCADCIPEFTIQFRERDVVIAALAFQHFELCQILDVGNLGLLQCSDEVFALFLWRDVGRLVKRENSEGRFFLDQLFVDLIQYFVDDLKVSFGSRPQTVVQHPVLE